MILKSNREVIHWGRDKMADNLQKTFSDSIFFNENLLETIRMPLKFVRKGPIDNDSALVQKMFLFRSSKPLSEPLMA